MATKYVDSLGTTGIPAVGDQLLGSKTSSGNIRFVTEKYTMDGTESASDFINIGKLHKGEMVLSQLSDVVVTTDLAGASTTLDIGDDDGSGSDTRYATALDVAAVGRVALDAYPVYEITEEGAWLRASFAVVNTPAEGGVIWFRIAIRRV